MYGIASRLCTHNRICILSANLISLWILIARMYILPQYAIERKRIKSTVRSLCKKESGACRAYTLGTHAKKEKE
jgi:hypothetical protein